jgi:hypothetical protein
MLLQTLQLGLAGQCILYSTHMTKCVNYFVMVLQYNVISLIELYIIMWITQRK